MIEEICIGDLIPHEKPMIMVDKLIFVDDLNVHCQVFINKNNIFFDKKTNSIGSWVGIEFMAQTIAVWSGYHKKQNNEAPTIGFLLGGRRYKTEVEHFKEDQVLDVFATKLMQNENMAAFKDINRD